MARVTFSVLVALIVTCSTLPAMAGSPFGQFGQFGQNGQSIGDLIAKIKSHSNKNKQNDPAPAPIPTPAPVPTVDYDRAITSIKVVPYGDGLGINSYAFHYVVTNTGNKTCPAGGAWLDTLLPGGKTAPVRSSNFQACEPGKSIIGVVVFANAAELESLRGASFRIRLPGNDANPLNNEMMVSNFQP
jgi:hypothetical protein